MIITPLKNRVAHPQLDAPFLFRDFFVHFHAQRVDTKVASCTFVTVFFLVLPLLSFCLSLSLAESAESCRKARASPWPVSGRAQPASQPTSVPFSRRQLFDTANWTLLFGSKLGWFGRRNCFFSAAARCHVLSCNG